MWAGSASWVSSGSTTIEQHAALNHTDSLITNWYGGSQVSLATEMTRD